MKEQDYQSKLIKYLNSVGAYTVKVVSASKKGVPDIIACYKGYFIGIEVKTPSTKHNTSDLQDLNLEWITNAGGYAIVAVEVSDLHATLEYIDRRISEN